MHPSQPDFNLSDKENQEVAEHLAEEWLHVEQALDAANIQRTIVFFGSARIEKHPKHHAEENPLANWQSKTYQNAYKLALAAGQMITQCQLTDTKLVTGGGPGIMEAANKGAHQAGQSSIGLNINIPREQIPNPYVDPSLSFSFHYFSLRKMHFLKRAAIIIVFPGGFGTLDELMEALTLMQTGKMPKLPIVLMDSQFWRRLINFEHLAKQGLIHKEDLDLFTVADSVDEAFFLIKQTLGC